MEIILEIQFCVSGAAAAAGGSVCMRRGDGGCLNRSSENKQFAISAGGCFIVGLIMLRRANLGSNTRPPAHHDIMTNTTFQTPVHIFGDITWTFCSCLSMFAFKKRKFVQGVAEVLKQL